MRDIFINDDIIFLAEIFNSLVAAESNTLISIATEINFSNDLVFKKIINQDGFCNRDGKAGFVKSIAIRRQQHFYGISQQRISLL